MSPGSDHQDGTTAAGRGRLRASHADRDHVIDMLKAAYVQGRLSKAEFDLRVGQALGSRTWAELDALTGDIPVFARVARSSGQGHRRGQAVLVSMAAMASIGLVLSGLLAELPPGAGPADPPSIHSTVTGAERRVQCGLPWSRPGERPPAGFVAGAAVECILWPVSLANVPQGQLVFIKRVADRGLAPLVAALRRRSIQSSPRLMCPVPLITIPTVFLIGRDGQVIRPGIPTGGCGMPLQQVLTALHLVPWGRGAAVLGQGAGRSSALQASPTVMP